MGYAPEPNVGDMSWFFRFFEKPKKPEATDLVFSLDFYNFYNELLKCDPSIKELLSLLPFSYHKIIIRNCDNAFNALPIIVFVIENDLTSRELVNYFSVSKN